MFDSFTRGNSTNISTGAPFSYTESANDAEILSNRLHPVTLNALVDVRADIDVSSTDMFAQMTLALLNYGTSVEISIGVLVRYSSSAITYYYTFIDGTSTSATQYLGKTVAGAATDLTNVAVTVAQGDTVRLEVQGDTLVGLTNGVQRISIAGGGAVTTGTRAGVGLFLAATTGGADTGITNLTADAIPGIRWVREVGTAIANTTGAASTAFTVGASGAQVADLLVAWVAVDNSGTNGAEPGLTVTDTGSNTWTTEAVALNDPGAANAGIAGYIAWTVVKTALVNANTITFTWGTGSPVAKGIVVNEFRGAAGLVIDQTTATGTSTSPSASRTATGSNQLVVGCIAVQCGTADAFTQDTDLTSGVWTGITRSGAGTTTSGATVAGAWKVVSASGAQTYDATITSRVWAEKIVIFGAVPVAHVYGVIPAIHPAQSVMRMAVR